MITKGQIMIKKFIFLIFLVLFTGNLSAETKTYKMVFVPASEKGDESDYTSLIAIIEKLTDRKSTRLNSSHSQQSRMPSSA